MIGYNASLTGGPFHGKSFSIKRADKELRMPCIVDGVVKTALYEMTFVTCARVEQSTIYYSYVRTYDAEH